jgi:RNA polymerase sigma factor (sigma-70 family)
MKNDAVGMWLEAATRYPVPSYAEQIILATAIQRGRQPDATPRQKRAGKRAVDRMVSGNLKLVVAIAMKYRRGTQGAGCSLEMEDLLQIGAIGLHKAALLFDHTRGFRFSTYSYWWIKQAITRELIYYRGAYRVPTPLQDLSRRWAQRPAGQSVEDFIAAWPQHKYTPALIIEAQTATAHLAGIASLDAPLAGGHDDGDAATLLEMIGSGGDEAEELLEQIDRQGILAVAEAMLPDDLELVRLRDLDGASPSELGALLGVSKNSVRDRVCVSKQRLRAVLEPCLAA